MRRILAVDDDASSAELVARVAERCGYESFATSDSRGVINLVRALRPDVLAVDISMPHLDAAALFRLLAGEGVKADILIVSGQETDVLNAHRVMAEDLGLHVPFVQQKPLDFKSLRQMLSSLNAAA